MAEGLRANYADHFGTTTLPVLEEIFWMEVARHESAAEKIFKKVSHDRDIWQYTEQHDLPQFSSVAENASYTFTKPLQGYDKTLTAVKYGLGVSFSEELFEDQKYDLVGDAVKKLGKSAKESQEVVAMGILNNAFGSTTTPDGQPLCDQAHLTPSGTYTVRNELAVAADLSETSLKQAIADFETVFVGDSNIIMRIMPKMLIVPSALRLYAKELVGSDRKPDSADNNMNSLKSEGLIVVSSPHLSDSDAWFIAAAPEETGLRIIERKPIETKAAGPDYGFATDTIAYKSRYRRIQGAVHPYGLFGSPGA